MTQSKATATRSKANVAHRLEATRAVRLFKVPPHKPAMLALLHTALRTQYMGGWWSSYACKGEEGGRCAVPQLELTDCGAEASAWAGVHLAGHARPNLQVGAVG